jgi:GNAT superfamily N-acetyltransferase
MHQREALVVRNAREADLASVEAFVTDFVRGHPAERQVRSREKLRDAYFGDRAVANLIVAARGDRVVGMGTWVLIYDMFWSMYGANVEWLYVHPEHRRGGIVLAIIAEICACVREAGGEFLHGGGDGPTQRLYERAAMGWGGRECYLSAEAFQVFADLAGATPREIARGLPTVEQNREPARPRALVARVRRV